MSILFSDVVGFTQICSGITAMQVVDMLNLMYTKFDKLTEKHRVYKVLFSYSYLKKCIVISARKVETVHMYMYINLSQEHLL